MEKFVSMEIRIANISPKILQVVRDDAQKNMRTIAKQVLLIIKQYYGLENDVVERKPRVKAVKPVKKEWPEIRER